MSFAFFLMFVVMPIVIFTQKYCAIRDTMKKNSCSVLEAMKIYDKQERAYIQLRYSSNGYDSHHKPSYSNYQGSSYNDDHLHSPSYSYLPQNIHHKF